jgi:ferredoxin
MDRCIGCLSCEVTARSKQLPEGPRRQIIMLGPRGTGTAPRSLCVHGLLPLPERACVAACPTGAVKTGVGWHVYVEPDLCVAARPAWWPALGRGTVEPQSEKGRQVRPVQGPHGSGLAGLRHGLHHPAPQCRRSRSRPRGAALTSAPRSSAETAP